MGINGALKAIDNWMSKDRRGLENSQVMLSNNSVHMRWPPSLRSAPMVMGEMVDTSGRKAPRDIGRSISLGGKLYYIFGDTFGFDSFGQFKGCSNNTIALIQDPQQPTQSTYLSKQLPIPLFVPYTGSEAKFTHDHSKENWRIVNWVFGGIVESLAPGSGVGWCFYDKIETHGGSIERGYGTGIARVSLAPPTCPPTGLMSSILQPPKVDDGILCERVKPKNVGTGSAARFLAEDQTGDGFMLFGTDEPCFGSISILHAPDGWVYCLGGYQLVNYLARVRADADFSDRSAYQFLCSSWSGPQWRSSYNAVNELQTLGDLNVMGHASLLYLPDHGPRGRPFVCIGCDKFLSSKIFVACAERMEGPWRSAVLCDAPKAKAFTNHRYCIYPHVWASNLANGEMVISWSDDGSMGARCIMGRFQWEMER
ncbi:hypothetical protein FH972_024932 [Carpinus fangiana]|uniref:DUF4185 domain-containing protein n=1 Tax=Carpinus fangiana TaxID=176857 RepID=A0A5N6KZR1_9ROSI|nr:hypothetical protein FH972_024932 [Carpinus fangiana]